MEIKIGLAPDDEALAPNTVIERTIKAEKAGFDSAWFGDFVHPYNHNKGQNPFAWILISSAAERTKRIMLGTGVTPFLNHYHPFVVAQAFATLETLYPKRIALGVGAGYYGGTIPKNDSSYLPPMDRLRNLDEAVKIVKKLWTSDDFINFKGRHYDLGPAFLYTKPKAPPPIYWCALGYKSAEFAGQSQADHFMTSWGTPPPTADEKTKMTFYPDHYKKILENLEKGAKKIGRDTGKIEKVMQVWGSYSKNEAACMKQILDGQGRFIPKGYIFSYLPATPPWRQELLEAVTQEDIKNSKLIYTSPDQIIDVFEKSVKIGFNHIYWYDASPDFDELLKSFREKIIPYFKK